MTPTGTALRWKGPDGTVWRVRVVDLGQRASASGAPLSGLEFIETDVVNPRRHVVPEWEVLDVIAPTDEQLAALLAAVRRRERRAG